jgi:hypothetical protein
MDTEDLNKVEEFYKETKSLKEQIVKEFPNDYQYYVSEIYK